MFRRFMFFVFILCIFSSTVFSQDNENEKKEEPTYGWDNKFISTLNLTQTALSNWTQGGDNAWVGRRISIAFLDRKKKNLTGKTRSRCLNANPK